MLDDLRRSDGVSAEGATRCAPLPAVFGRRELRDGFPRVANVPMMSEGPGMGAVGPIERPIQLMTMRREGPGMGSRATAGSVRWCDRRADPEPVADVG